MKARLGDLTTIKTGKLDANASSPDGDYPFFTCAREPLRIASYSYDCECVLVAGNGDLNVKYYNGKFDAYQRTYIIEDNGSRKLYLPYLYYFMDFYLDELRKQSIGGIIKYIRLANLTDAKIELLNLDDQKKVSDILSGVSELISTCHLELVAFDNLVKSRFVEVFGDPDNSTLCWPIEHLSEHLQVVGGFAFKSDQFQASGIPVLRIGNINTGSFIPRNMVFWKDDPALERFKVYPGDLLMSLTGTVGKDDYGNVCILGDDYPEYYLNQRNAKLELDGSLDGRYLSEYLKFPSVKRRLTGISRGVRQANISNRDILALTVPMPPLPLQQKFAAFVSQVDNSRFAVQQAIDQLETLKASLMQEYFG